jgi:hypothetical protein
MSKRGTELQAPIENAFVCNYVSDIWVEVFPYERGAAREAVIEAARAAKDAIAECSRITAGGSDPVLDTVVEAIEALEEVER